MRKNKKLIATKNHGKELTKTAKEIGKAKVKVAKSSTDLKKASRIREKIRAKVIKTANVIFQNLLSNAVKYTQENGKIEVKIEKSKEWVIISIKDNGCGIPEDAKKQIFTKLFRADNVRAKEPSGTGLGLYLVKKLVDKLGGKVWFESTEGVGTTFFVSLKK